MQHKTLRILGVFLGFIIFGFAVAYDYYISIGINIGARLGLKISPILACMLYVIIYLLLYRTTIYSFFMLIALFFCMLGDIFIGFYDPSLDNTMSTKMIHLLLGGGAFTISRFLFAIIFAIKPYKKMALLKHNWKLVLISHSICTLPFLLLGVLILAIKETVVAGCVLAYLLLGFGIPMSYGILRLVADTKESSYSRILSLMGISFFNLSDILLIIAMYTKLVPEYTILISDNIYWISMYFFTISIIRSSYENVERGLM